MEKAGDSLERQASRSSRALPPRPRIPGLNNEVSILNNYGQQP